MNTSGRPLATAANTLLAAMLASNGALRVGSSAAAAGLEARPAGVVSLPPGAWRDCPTDPAYVCGDPPPAKRVVGPINQPSGGTNSITTQSSGRIILWSIHQRSGWHPNLHSSGFMAHTKKWQAKKDTRRRALAALPSCRRWKKEKNTKTCNSAVYHECGKASVVVVVAAHINSINIATKN